MKKNDINRIPVSICMATYNGIKYIENQINTILPQLNDNDELLISDDGSTDGTWEYLNQLQKDHSNITVVKGPCKGANANFFSLLFLAGNDIIFISDQDDEWNLNKIDIVSSAFSKNPTAMVVLHKDIIYNSSNGEQISCVPQKHGVINNLIRNSYSGHRMAIKKEFLSSIMYKTDYCPAYDQYIGLLAEKKRVGYFISDILDRHIIHGNNISHPLSIYNKLRIRIKLLRCILNSN